MTFPLTPTTAVVDYLNTTYFDRVWNATTDHGAVNVALGKQAARVQVGAVPVGLSVVGLPTTDLVYAVWHASVQSFGKYIQFQQNQWITDSAILASTGVLVNGFTAGGRSVPAGTMYFRYDPVNASVLVAVATIYTRVCLGDIYPDLYLRAYLDTSRQTPVQTALYKVVNSTKGKNPPTPSVVAAAIAAAVVTYPAGVRLFINGWMYSPLSYPALKANNIVELLIDPDIAGYVDIPISGAQTGYYSTLYHEQRNLLHVPKTINPTNILITTDTLLMMVFDPVSGKGAYGHTLDPHALESITHNDFSISQTVVQGFQASLRSQNVSVRLYVRFATNPTTLSDDANRLTDLYSLPDLEIKKQLLGLSANQIPEWQANHLEQSDFLNLMYQPVEFDTSDVLTQFVDAMGYYDVASTLSQSMHYYTYKGAQVALGKPVRLSGYPVSVIAWADGRKIPDSYVGLSNYSGDSFLIGFESGGYINVGSRIGLYITEGGDRTPITFNPTSASHSITVSGGDYSLVQIISYPTAQPVWQGSSQLGYHLFPVSPGDYTIAYNSNGTATFTVSPPHYNQKFYLLPQCGLLTLKYDLDPALNAKQPLILPLTFEDDKGNSIPLITQQGIEVYLNGYRLVEGLDYTCNPVTGTQSDILQTLLVVSNLDYVDRSNTNNLLEVVIHGDAVPSKDAGYVISNTMHRTAPPMIWSPYCGRAYARGKLIEGATESGNTVTSPQAIADGSPYLLEWSLPYPVSKLLSGLSPNNDLGLRTRIDLVLGLTQPTFPSTVVINKLYALYSPYLAQIITDVAAGTFTVVNDPTDSGFLAQFAPYGILSTRDPILGSSNPLVDRRFVSLAAHYANFAVKDPTQMILVQRLITLLLKPSSISVPSALL